jgi:hypothetical protein
MQFEEGSHGDYVFNNLQSFYFDKDIEGLKHIIPNGPMYKPAECRVLFMRDYYYGYLNGINFPSTYTNSVINWYRYWKIDGTVEQLNLRNIKLVQCTG